MSTDRETERLDARARRAAKRVGWIAIKSRRAQPLENYGGFMIVDPYTRFPVHGFNYDLTAEAVIDVCNWDEG